MKGLTPAQVADLSVLFLQQDGPVPQFITNFYDTRYVLVTDISQFATAAQGINADTAYSWGNHAVAGYALASSLSSYATTGSVATATQGSHADTAFGWGNHASAGYLTVAPVQVLEQFSGVNATLVLGDTPTAGSTPIIFVNHLMLRMVDDWTIAGDTITLVIPMGGGDVADVYYQA